MSRNREHPPQVSTTVPFDTMDWGDGKSQPLAVPAVPAQEAPREACLDCGGTGDEGHNFCLDKDQLAYRAKQRPAEPQAGAQPTTTDDGMGISLHGKRRGFAVPPAAEPQAGAQVPSQDQGEYELFLKTAAPSELVQRIRNIEAHLNSIANYAEEAAKTPITRESISAEKIETPRPTPPDPCSVGKRTVTVAYPVMQTTKYIDAAESYISQLEAALKAQTLTGLSQFDEMQGLCRLILSESGGSSNG